MILTSANVIAFLKLATADQDRVDTLIAWAQARAELIIGRSLESEARTALLAGRCARSFMLPVIPVTEITSICLDATRTFDSPLSSGDYHLDNTSGIIRLYYDHTPYGVATVQVIYTAGYTEDTLPADLKMALMECISWNAKRLNDQALGISSHNTPDGVGLSYEMVLPLGAQRVFESYRDVRC
jgi:uncharacterized phiE125 gp8 family phage protein